MQRRSLRILGCLVAGLLLGSTIAAPPTPESRLPLAVRIARECNVQPDAAEAMLKSLGMEAARDLRAGETVTLPGLGTLRIVRIGEYKDLDSYGRPVTIAAHNTVEFIPEGGLTEQANKSDIKPAVTVPAFEFNPLHDAEPGQRTRGSRAPGIRTPPR
jgi:nucleoid DNA-binding protein